MEWDNNVKLRILLVEDEPLLLEATREDLDDLGHEVLCATNGDQALEVINVQTIDLLITDIRMPGECDGWELARRARQMLPQLPVIYTSGYATRELPPVDDSIFLSKPFRLSELAGAIGSLISPEPT